MKWFKIKKQEVINGKLLSLVIYNKDINEKIKKGTHCAWVENPDLVFDEKVVLCYGNVLILGNTTIRSELDETVEIENSTISDCNLITRSTGTITIYDSIVENADIENVEDSESETFIRAKHVLINKSTIVATEESTNKRIKIANDGRICISSSTLKFNAAEAIIETHKNATVDLKDCSFDCVARLEATEDDASLLMTETKSEGDKGFSVLAKDKTNIYKSLFCGVTALFFGNGKIKECEFRDAFSIFSDSRSIVELTGSIFSEFAQITINRGNIMIKNSEITGRTKVICHNDDLLIAETRIRDNVKVRNADLLNCTISDNAFINNVALRHFDVRKNSKVGFFLDGQELDKRHFPIKTVLAGEEKNNPYKVEKNTDFYIFKDCFSEDMAIFCQPNIKKYTFAATQNSRQLTFEDPISVLKYTLEKSKTKIKKETLEFEILSCFFDGSRTSISIPSNVEKILETFPRNNNKKELITTSIIMFWNSFFNCHISSERDIEDTLEFLSKVKSASLIDIMSKKIVINSNMYIFPKDLLKFISKGKETDKEKQFIIVGN